jgi:hypothetical protein
VIATSLPRCRFCAGETELIFCGMMKDPNSHYSLCCVTPGGTGLGQCPVRPVGWGRTEEAAVADYINIPLETTKMTKPKSKPIQDLWKGRCNDCGTLLVISPGSNSEKICVNQECPPYVRRRQVLRWLAFIAIFVLAVVAFQH